MYKKLSKVNYSIIDEYSDTINYIGKMKYNEINIWNTFKNNLACRTFDANKIFYYYTNLKNIFKDIFNTCERLNVNEDKDYISFKDNTTLLISILNLKVYISESQIWKILNENIYNIEDKLITFGTMLKLSKDGYEIENRKISNSSYDVRYTCSLKYLNKIIFRIYYNPISENKTIKLFAKGLDSFKGLTRDHIQIISEEQLDDILNQYIEIINA